MYTGQVAQQRLLPEHASSKVFEILFENDEVTWKQIIFGLIEAEQMNPWDINISNIAQKFIEMLKQLKQLDFRISGKIVLASAILLKLKSSKLIDEEIAALDNLISSADEPLDMELLEELPLEGSVLSIQQGDRPRVIPKSPQPRKRKVSVFDLVEALEKALETDAKRVRQAPRIIEETHPPTSHIDMGSLIKEMYNKVSNHYQEGQEKILSFSDLIPSDAKEDKVLTFIPLLHLDFQRKVDVAQEEHFGPIAIHLLEQGATFSEADLTNL